MEKDQALQRLNTSRQRLIEAINGASETQRGTIQVEGIWTVKDLVGHICAWEDSLNKPLHSYLQAGEFAPEPIPDHDAWNARQASLRDGNSFEEVLAEAKITRQELVRLADRLAPADWEIALPAPWGGHETLAQMIDGLAWHEEEHTKSIEEKFSR